MYTHAVVYLPLFCRHVQANQAAKKAQKASVSLSARLQQWILPINVRAAAVCCREASDRSTSSTLNGSDSLCVQQVIYTLVRFVWYHDTVTRWTLVGYLFLLGTTYLSYSWVVSAAEEGGSSEYDAYYTLLAISIALHAHTRACSVLRYAMDVLLITLFTHAGLIVSDYFWLLFLAVRVHVAVACVAVKGQLSRAC